MYESSKPLNLKLACLIGSMLFAFVQPAQGQPGDGPSMTDPPQPPQFVGEHFFALEALPGVENGSRSAPGDEWQRPFSTINVERNVNESSGTVGGLWSDENGERDDGYYTTGAPIVGDGGFFFNFPEEEHRFYESPLEIIPTVLTWPAEPIGNLFSRVVRSERTELETALHDDVLDIQPVPERPPLVIEWNERFLGPGTLAPGFTTPTGAVWRPSLWVWGEVFSGFNYFDNGVADPVAEWANRVDLFAQLNLSGTERILYAVRPLDQETDDGTGRRFAGYDLRNGDWLPGGNFDIQSLFFEGDVGEILPFLDPYDFRALDFGMSVGRMPILAQQGLLINEDRIDAVTLTRNTLYGHGNLNLRTTGVYAWDQISRNSPIVGNPNRLSNKSQMMAILTESDFRNTVINADVAYVSGDVQQRDLVAVGVSGIQRHYMNHNTYNTSLHWLASYPTNGEGDYARLGQLLFGQLSWTPHHYYDLIYLNAFWAIDEFTSPARGPLQGGPLGQTGLVFAATALGRFGAPLPVTTNDTAGVSLGYQWFFDESRKQVIWEFGGSSDTEGNRNEAQAATAMRYQQAIGQHYIWRLDGFVAEREGRQTSVGGRTEIRVKF